MDELLLRKARNLADGFAAADTDDVAVVLGEALLEALAGLLVPEDERDPEAAILCGSWSPEDRECDMVSGHDGDHRDWLGHVWSDSVADAKRQHPAYQPPTSAGDVRPMRDPYAASNPIGCGGVLRPVVNGPIQPDPHPEFLEGEAAYEAAPIGTRVDHFADGVDGWEKFPEGWFSDAAVNHIAASTMTGKRRVLRWGD